MKGKNFINLDISLIIFLVTQGMFTKIKDGSQWKIGWERSKDGNMKNAKDYLKLLRDITFCDSFGKLKRLKTEIEFFHNEYNKREDSTGKDLLAQYLKEIINTYHNKEKEFKNDRYQWLLIIIAFIMVFLTGISIIVNMCYS